MKLKCKRKVILVCTPTSTHDEVEKFYSYVNETEKNISSLYTYIKGNFNIKDKILKRTQ